MIRNFSKILKRIIIFVTLVSLCTCVIFVSSRPKIAKAEALSVAALGAGALAAVLGSYFATAGVQLIFDGGSDTTLTEYFNSIKQEYEEQTQNYNTYFNDQGEFIGNEEDLSLFVSDQGMAYWNMGKDTESWLNDLKNWFVSDNSLSSTSTSIYSDSGISVGSLNYPLYVNNDHLHYPASSSIPSLVPIVPNTSGTFLFDNGAYFSYSFGSVSNHELKGTFILYNSLGNQLGTTRSVTFEGWVGYSYDIQRTQGIALANYYGTYEIARVSRYRDNYAVTDCIVAQQIFAISADYFTSYNISVEGSLTDGYQDFQDAIDQSHTDQADNPDAVISVGVDVGSGALTADQVREIILQMLLDGTLVGTYEGTYENIGEAEQDQDQTETETPTYPEGWVVINGLEDFFPFCIPWDLYSIIEILNVPPETPSFTYTVSTGGLFGDEDIEVDLSPFDGVAQIFRIMMAIGFIVFLIIKTRDMIRG